MPKLTTSQNGRYNVIIEDKLMLPHICSFWLQLWNNLSGQS